MLRSVFLFLLSAVVLTAAAQSENWTRVESVPAVELYALTAKNDTLYTAAGFEIYATYDGGDSWERLPAAVPEAAVLVTALLRTDAALYAGTSAAGVYRSPDEGATWTPLSNGLGPWNSTTVNSLTLSRDTIYAGTEGGVYRLVENTDNTWRAYNEGLFSNLSYGMRSVVAMPGFLLGAAGYNGHLYRRAPTDAEWQAIPIGSPFISDLGATSFDSIGNQLFTGTSLGVYRSTDHGLTWLRMPAGLPHATFLYLQTYEDRVIALINATHDAGYVYYAPADDSQPWQLIGAFPGDFVFALEIQGNYMYLATERGLYRSPVDQLTDINEPEFPGVQWQARVYPNPAGEHATLSLELEQAADLHLTWYDAQGRSLRALPVQSLPAGGHQLPLTLPGSVAGHYFLQVRVGRQVTVVRVLRQ